MLRLYEALNYCLSGRIFHNTKRLFFLFLMILVPCYYLGSFSHEEDERSSPLLVVLEEDSPPLVFYNLEEQLQGLLIELWEDIGEKLGRPVEFQLTQREKALPMIRDKQAHFHGNVMSLEEDREEALIYTEEIITLNTFLFVLSDIPARSLENEQIGPVGIREDGYEKQFMRRNYPDIELKEYPDVETMVSQAVQGEVKAFVARYYQGMYLLDQFAEQGAFRPLELLLSHALVAGIHPENIDFRENINQILADVDEVDRSRVTQRWMRSEEVTRTPPWLLATVSGGLIILLLSLFDIILYRERGRLLQTLTHKTEKLKESEEKYRLLFEKSPDAYLIFENGIFVDCNEAALELFRAEREQIVGKRPEEFLPRQPDGTLPEEGVRYWLNKAREKGSVRVEWMHKRLDGTNFWLDVSLVKMPHTSTPKYLVLFHDITPLKMAEERIRKNEQFLSSVVETQREMICRFLPDTTLTFVNKPYCRQVGMSEKDMLGRSFLDFIPEEEHKKILENLSALSAENPSQTFPPQWVERKGKIIWEEWTNSVILDDQKRVVEFQSTGRDITRQKKAMDALYESEEKFRQITENMGDVCWLRDAEKEELLYINPAFERLYGKSRQEIYDNPEIFIDFVHPEDKSKLLKSFKNYMDGGEYDSMEYRIVRGNGEIRWLHSKSFPVKSVDGKIIRHAGVSIDITDRKQLEEHLQFQVAFQRIATQTSFNFVTVDREEFDHVVEKTLKNLGELFRMERGYVFLFTDDKRQMKNTHKWRVRENNKQRKLFQHISTKSLPWWIKELQKLKPFYIPDVETLPSEAIEEKKILSMLEVRSIICLPIINRKGMVIGFMGFDSIDEKHLLMPEHISMLQVISDILAGAIERKQAQEALLESQVRYQQLSEQTATFTWDVDINGMYIYVSPSVEKVIGYKPKEITGKKYFYDLAPPAEKKDLRDFWKKIITRRKPVKDLENKIMTKEGRVLWVITNGMPLYDDKGHLIGYRGSDRDIDKLKKAEEERCATMKNLEETNKKLRENRSRFYTLARNTTAGIFIAQDERFKLVNPALCEIVEYSEKELLSMDCFDLVHPDNLEMVRERYVSRLKSREAPNIYEMKVITKSGKIRWVEINAGLISYEEKPAVIGTVFDITGC